MRADRLDHAVVGEEQHRRRGESIRGGKLQQRIDEGRAVDVRNEVDLRASRSRAGKISVRLEGDDLHVRRVQRAHDGQPVSAEPHDYSSR